MFSVYPNLLSIDGPDGVGKSSLSNVIYSLLRERIGIDKVVLVRPTYFETSKRARIVGENLNNVCHDIIMHSKYHNSFFLKCMQINYEDIVSVELKKGNFVILDSSEIRALAFILDKGEPEAINDTLLKIKNGNLIFNIVPQTRIVLSCGKNDILKNLSSKKCLDEGDPKNLLQVQQRIRAYDKAIDILKNHYYFDLPIIWEQLIMVHKTKDVNKYFKNLFNNCLSDIIERTRL